MIRTIEAIAVLATLSAVLVGALNYLNEHHAQRIAVLETELELRSEILDTDINRNAKIRHHYDQVEMQRPLTKPEALRKKYIESELERQYSQQETLHDKRLEMAQ